MDNFNNNNDRYPYGHSSYGSGYGTTPGGSTQPGAGREDAPAGQSAADRNPAPASPASSAPVSSSPASSAPGAQAPASSPATPAAPQHTAQNPYGWYGQPHAQSYGNSHNSFNNPSVYRQGYGQGPYGQQPPSQNPPEKKRGGAGRVLGGIALMLACLLCGFGGSWAAMAMYDSQNPGKETVVYQSVEPGPEASNTDSDTSLSDVAEAAGASVVSITTENMIADFTMGGRIVSGAGSGVIISSDGYIITNHHVVEGASTVNVTLPDGTEYPATFVGSDKQTDVAVIKIEADGLTPAVIGDSAELRVGEFCMAIGNPLGTLGGTVTDGIVSALDRTVNINNVNMTLLQMSAAVSPGNSGGGLFNARGELIGLVNAKSGDSEAEGLGFAIPVNTAMGIAETLITDGRVVRPGLGVTVVTVADEATAAQAGVDEMGVYINSLTQGGAAQAAGLQVGDRIVSIGGVDVESGDDLSREIQSHQVGDTLTLVVERQGSEMSVEVTLRELIAEA